MDFKTFLNVYWRAEKWLFLCMCFPFRAASGYDDFDDREDGMCWVSVIMSSDRLFFSGWTKQMLITLYFWFLRFEIMYFLLADLSNDECEAPENQDSFTQPTMVQPEIDIEVSEICFISLVLRANEKRKHTWKV